MEHCAIDLGGKKSQVCLRSADGAVLFERRCDTLALPELLRGLAPCRVILETAAEAFRVADVARAAGHDARVVPATLVRTLEQFSRRGRTFPIRRYGSESPCEPIPSRSSVAACSAAPSQLP
jgi:transposase